MTRYSLTHNTGAGPGSGHGRRPRAGTVTAWGPAGTGIARAEGPGGAWPQRQSARPTAPG